jgi:hypothetical protein
VGALGGGLFLFLAGGEQRLEQLIPNALASLRPLVWVIGIVLLGIVIYLTQSWAHGRFHLEKLTAGPATISLTDKSAYYFDEFLDDIVFYFQRTGKNVVIYEDLDRFDNAHIFDTLRELNTILNNASQLDARPIRFVYAIKDSMFEQWASRKNRSKLRSRLLTGRNSSNSLSRSCRSSPTARHMTSLSRRWKVPRPSWEGLSSKSSPDT